MLNNYDVALVERDFWVNVIENLNYSEKINFALVCKNFNHTVNEYASLLLLKNRDNTIGHVKIFNDLLIVQLQNNSPLLQKSALITSQLFKLASILPILSDHGFNAENQNSLDLILKLGANPNEFESLDIPTPLFRILNLHYMPGFIVKKDDKGKVSYEVNTIEDNCKTMYAMSWTLIKSGTDPRVVDMFNKDAFQVFCEIAATSNYCDSEKNKLVEDMNNFKTHVFEYIKSTGLDQQPIPKIPQALIADYIRNLYNDSDRINNYVF